MQVPLTEWYMMLKKWLNIYNDLLYVENPVARLSILYRKEALHARRIRSTRENKRANANTIWLFCFLFQFTEMAKLDYSRFQTSKSIYRNLFILLDWLAIAWHTSSDGDSCSFDVSTFADLFILNPFQDEIKITFRKLWPSTTISDWICDEFSCHLINTKRMESFCMRWK